ncbi:transcriptional regulator [Altererythrobacter sp. B11]|uniref:winged helix-turn-helix transcriptional regulator n=1 Tax=Altererythrobacter sp. B11 TaxID=2060312 RepID=UPI000DC6DE09|nr:transcriptional regulator [Altererythrobacter sp. B11]
MSDRHINVPGTDPVPLRPDDGRSCRAVNHILSCVGDKWSMQVVMSLSDGSQRFNALRRTIDGISQRMLTRTLRRLERDGLVERTVTPSVPPRVDYALSDLGRSLRVPVLALGSWAVEHQGAIDTARSRFDAENAIEE